MLTCVSLEPIIYTIFQHVDVKHTSPLVLTWQQISKTVKRPRRSNYLTTQGSPKHGHSNKSKAELLHEGIFFLINLFARDVLVLKTLEMEKTKPTFIISVLKDGN